MSGILVELAGVVVVLLVMGGAGVFRDGPRAAGR